MKRENSHREFDDLIREKLMGSPEEPESLLWKRLQDQLRYNDEIQRARKRMIFMLSSLLIGISICLLTLLANWPMARDAKPVQARSSNQHAESLVKSRKFSAQKKENGTRDEVKVLSKQEVLTPSIEKNTAQESTQITPVHNSSRSNSAKNIEQNSAFEMPSVSLSIENPGNDVAHEADRIEKSEPTTAEVMNNVEASNSGNQQEGIHEADLAEEMEVQILPVKPVLGPMSSSNLSKFSLWMQLNPAYSYRTVSDKSGITGPTTAQFNSAEQGKTNVNVGFGAAYAIRPMITVRSGVQWTSYQSLYAATNSSVPVDTASNRVGIETVYGTYYVSENEFHHKDQEDPEEYEFNEEDSTSLCLTFTNEQTIRILQIPMSIEFGVQQGKMRYLAGAGFVYGFASKAVSDVNVEGFNPIVSNTIQLFSRSTVSGAFHFGVEYAISEKLSLRATPSFTYMLTKMNQSSNRSTHGFWGGVDMGFRFYLN